MAGPWFVDPEGGSLTNNGLSTTTPWLLIPGQTGATAQTGYGVVAGDTINVKNGTRSSNGRLILPADNLTYRGYGLASNVLYLKLPAKDPSGVITQTTVREAGVHEGVWTLYEPTETNSIVAYFTRSGCVIEDIQVIAPLSATPISMGTATSTAIGCTLRRSKVVGSAATGIEAYSRQITISDCEVRNIDDDAITLGASASNGYRAGYVDTISRVSVIEPGLDGATAIGDALQTFADSGRFESSLVIEDFYVYKTSAIKQALTLTDILGGLILQRFHFSGQPEGHCQILFSGIGGNFIVRDGYIKEGCAGNAVFRYAGTQGIETGATLTISNVLVDAEKNAGFFAVGASTDAATVDGVITIEHCTINGVNTQSLSYTGGISIDPGANITLGANAGLVARNNCITTTGQPAFRIPTGGGNDARWQIKNNAINGNSFAIGSTTYATVALFETAHSGATNNIDAVPLLDKAFRPKATSPLLNQGIFYRYTADLGNVQRNNPPTIGTYEYLSTRSDAGSRGTR